MNHSINKVTIVLVETSHPGNIGGAARAMKTMAHKKLSLVRPKLFPSAEATARATGADDILANASLFDDLEQAIADCDLVIGTSARIRSIPWPLFTPRDCAGHVSNDHYSSVAIVFGRESSGLSNAELALCNMVLQIPTNKEYGSLNLAAAVQIICYEIYTRINSRVLVKEQKNQVPLVRQDKMQQLYTHMEQCMIETGFLDQNNPGKLMHRLHRLFNRAKLDEDEWHILRGFFAKVQEKNRADSD